jgi:hypothetical protein
VEEIFQWFLENGAAAIPFIAGLWVRLEMIGRKINSNSKDISRIKWELTKVKEENRENRKEMFHREGQFNEQ